MLLGHETALESFLIGLWDVAIVGVVAIMIYGYVTYPGDKR